MQELIVFLIAALPIAEVRGSIPYGLFNNIPLTTTLVLSIIGNFIPVIPCLLLLESVSNYLRKYAIWDKFFTWLFARTRKHSDAIEKYEALGLAIFVGIPLPLTGAWSGCVAAFIFGIRFWRAMPAILAGIIMASVIVTLVCLGAINIGSLSGIFTTKISF
ncbi:small multi-drug export protein [Candidatus Poribacteria bacterium]|nr:small multi-drug export protein [Candidatus Poribacteria bacterium]